MDSIFFDLQSVNRPRSLNNGLELGCSPTPNIVINFWANDEVVKGCAKRNGTTVRFPNAVNRPCGKVGRSALPIRDGFVMNYARLLRNSTLCCRTLDIEYVLGPSTLCMLSKRILKVLSSVGIRQDKRSGPRQKVRSKTEKIQSLMGTEAQLGSGFLFYINETIIFIGR